MKKTTSLQPVDFEIIDKIKYPIIFRKSGFEFTDPCPFCSQKHKHGMTLGHRLPHCIPPYSKMIVLSDGTEVKQEAGYLLREY